MTPGEEKRILLAHGGGGVIEEPPLYNVEANPEVLAYLTAFIVQ